MPAFVSGTKTFFQSTNAPTGWTKETTNDDYESALKIERTNCCVTTIEYANEIHLNCNSEMSANPVSDLNEFNYTLN